MPVANKFKSKLKQRGVGLIEVLISGLVLSIGFLSVAALQSKSLSTNNSAMARNMAVLASYSILDVMRADRANALTGLYNKKVIGGSCPSGRSLADSQIKQWCAQLGENLGEQASTIAEINCKTNGDCTVSVQFDDSHAGKGGSVQQQVITRTML
jgi:type IV pilus assembly protein PilV